MSSGKDFFLFDSLDVSLECGDFVGVLLRLALLAEQPDPVVQPAIPRQRHVEEGPPEAGDDPRRPRAVAAEVRPDEDHGGRDLAPLALPALVPVRRGNVGHDVVRAQLALALDVGADKGPELADALVLKGEGAV